MRESFDPINIRFAQLITKLSRSKEFRQFFRSGSKSRSMIRIKRIYSATKISEARKSEKKAAQIETGHELHMKAPRTAWNYSRLLICLTARKLHLLRV